MADLGAIARPNGRIATAAWAIKSSLLWQNQTPYAWNGLVEANGAYPASLFAIKSAVLWQNTGGPHAYEVRTNALSEQSLFSVPWYRFLTDNVSLSVQASLYDCNGSIYGKVTITAIRQPNARVHLLEGNEMTVVGLKYTNALGEYRFDGLPKSFSNFTILVDDPTGQYNQGRLDNLTPV